MLTCKDTVNEPFAVINADDYYGQESYAVLANALDALDASSKNYCMVGFLLSHTLSDHGSVTRGLCRSNVRGYLEALEEISGIEKTATGASFTAKDGSHHVLTGEELVSMNMWGFVPKVFADLEQEFVAFLRSGVSLPKSELVIPTTVGVLVSRGQATVRVLRTTSPWFGITHPADKPEVVRKVTSLVNSAKYPRNLWA
jgi:hypothetical protein